MACDHFSSDLIPYFINTGSTLSITTAETVGTTVSTLTVTDDDTDDVSGLTISVDANTYFDVSGASQYLGFFYH